MADKNYFNLKSNSIGGGSSTTPDYFNVNNILNRQKTAAAANKNYFAINKVLPGSKTGSSWNTPFGNFTSAKNEVPPSLRATNSSGEQPAEDPYAWLKDLLGGGGGGGSRRAYSDEEVAATSAKLQALYDRYAQDVASREADIAATYDKSGTNLGSIYDTSVGNINKAYDAARAAQTQQLLALGMTEQTPVSQFGNQTEAVTSLNNLRAAVLAQNEATKNTAITNQRLASEAAKREGAQQAAKVAAQMASQMVSTGGGGGGGLSPYQYASLVLQQQKADASNQYNAAKLAGAGSNQVSGSTWDTYFQQALDAGEGYQAATNFANSRAKVR